MILNLVDWDTISMHPNRFAQQLGISDLSQFPVIQPEEFVFTIPKTEINFFITDDDFLQMEFDETNVEKIIFNITKYNILMDKIGEYILESGAGDNGVKILYIIGALNMNSEDFSESFINPVFNIEDIPTYATIIDDILTISLKPNLIMAPDYIINSDGFQCEIKLEDDETKQFYTDTWTGSMLDADASLDKYYLTFPYIEGYEPTEIRSRVTHDIIKEGQNLYSYLIDNVNGTKGNIEIYYSKLHVHNYELTSQTEATCTQSGSATYTCVDNDDSYTEITPVLGHNIVNGICTRCGFKVLSVKKQLKDQEEKKVYPKTVAEAIIDDNGNPLMSLIQRFTAGEGIEINNNEISVTYGFADKIKY